MSDYVNSLKTIIENKNIVDEIDCLRTICLTVTDNCNLRCSYCPHSLDFGDNEHNMTIKTVKQIIYRLNEINYDGRITISGFGEPMLLPWIIDILYELRYFNVDLLTNGLVPSDYREDIEKLTNSIIVSVHNINNLSIIKENWPTAIIRNHDINDTKCELNINNRAGYLNNETNNNICTYPFYKMMIDYDGKYLLCCNDWNRRTATDNVDVFHMPIEEYFIKYIKKYKDNLSIGCRENICSSCNMDGTLIGMEYLDWYNRKED